MYAVNELADYHGDWTFSCSTVNLLLHQPCSAMCRLLLRQRICLRVHVLQPDKSTSQQSAYIISYSIERQSTCIIQRQGKGTLWYLPVQAFYWARREGVFRVGKFWWFFFLKSMFLLRQSRRLEMLLIPTEIPGWCSSEQCSSAYDFSVTGQHVLLTIAALLAEPQCEQKAKARNRFAIIGSA